MAKTDMLVRLGADTKNYDANIAKASRQLDQFKKDNLSLGGVMKQATSAMVGMAAQFMTIGAAIKVAGEALKKNELVMDEWGRTTQSASAIFDSFVNSLNTSDFSGFFQNIRNVVSAARQAYDALDELGTFNAFNQINVQKAQTGFVEAISNFREGKGKMADVRSAAETLKTELGTRMQKENEAYVAAIKQLAESRKVDADMLMKALSGSYGSYEELKNTPLTGTKTVYHAGAPGTAGYATEVAVAATEQERLGQMLKKLSDDELNNLQALGAQAERTATEIAQIDKQVARVSVTDKAQQDRAAKEASKPQEKAQEKVTNALEDYANSMAVAKIRFEAGLDDEEKYKTNMLSAHQRLFSAYSEASALYEDPEYKTAIQNEVTEIKALSQAVKELKDAKEAQKVADRELEQAEKEAARQIRQLDTSILNGLTGAAKRVGWTSADLGTAGLKTKINAGIDITEEEWTAVQNRLNSRLQSLGLDPIQINFETGNIEEVFDKVKQKNDEMIASFSSGVGAVGSLVGAMDNLKNIGDDLAAAFSGEMDAWDAMMTVFNSGISILETVVTVIQAIQTLEELSIALSQKKAATKLAEATTVATAAGTEAAAEGAAAVASGAAAGANAAEASSAAGKAVSWIPIVGPILAVAAIAAVLGSTLAAISQAKSSGKGFAAGGIVPGNSFSGDNVRGITPSGEVFGLNSGEVVLNHAQTNNLANELEGGRGGGVITGTVTGSTIYLALANFAKQNNKLAGTTGGLVLKIE